MLYTAFVENVDKFVYNIFCPKIKRFQLWITFCRFFNKCIIEIVFFKELLHFCEKYIKNPTCETIVGVWITKVDKIRDFFMFMANFTLIKNITMLK